jgi:uncharacterized delta-60 repeat protein
MIHLKKLLLITLIITFNLYSQDDFLDTTFGNQGKLLFKNSTSSTTLTTMATQSNGKVIVIGSLITRLNLDGTIDTSFGNEGYITKITVPSYDYTGSSNPSSYRPFYATAIYVYPDDSFIVGFFPYLNDDDESYFHHMSLLYKYNSNGELDSNFNYDGYENSFGHGGPNERISIIKALDNGNIYIGGGDYSSMGNWTTVYKILNANGSEINEYNIYLTAIELQTQSDGKYIICGHDRDPYYPITIFETQASCMRLNSNGIVDPSFNVSILPQVGFYRNIKSAIVQNDDKIIVLGSKHSLGTDPDGIGDLYTYRLNQNGTIDTSYGNNGEMIVGNFNVGFGFSRSMKAKIIKDNNNFYVIFSQNSIILVKKYDSNGVFISQQEIQPTSSTNNFADIIKTLDNKYFMGSNTSCANLMSNLMTVTKTNSAYEFDSTFGGQGVVRINSVIEANEANTSSVGKSVVQNDRKILVLSNGEANRVFINRFNEDGSEDITFYNNFENTNCNINKINTLSLQPDQKILVGTSEHNFNTNITSYTVYRLNVNGTLDTSFGDNGSVELNFSNQPNRFRIVTNNNNFLYLISDKTISRINALGGVDQNFGVNGLFIYDQLFYKDVVLYNNDILLGGYISNLLSNENGVQQQRFFSILKISQTGVIDTSFADQGLFKYSFFSIPPNYGQTFANDLSRIETLHITSDNKILALGVSPGELIGNPSTYALKLNATGTLDNSFGVSGEVLLDENNVMINAVCHSNNSISVISRFREGDSNKYHFLTKHYSENGVIDTDFGDNGSVLTDFGSGLVNGSIDTPVQIHIDNLDRLVAVGRTNINGNDNSFISIARYNNETLSQEIINYDENTVVAIVKEKLEFVSFRENMTSIQLYDILGKLVFEGKQLNNKGYVIDYLNKTNKFLLARITLESGDVVSLKVIY